MSSPGCSGFDRSNPMQSLPILYSFRRCPWAIRARMALLISGQTVEIREVALGAKPEEMLIVSPKGTVPVLVLPDGMVIEQSLDIMRWALGRNDPEHWLNGDDADLIAANDGPFKHHLEGYKYSARHGSDPLEHRAAGLIMLVGLDQRLSVAGQLCGPHRTLTDIALFPLIRQFAETDRSWFDAQSVTHLQSWLAGHVGSALFGEAMVRRAPWQPGDAAAFLSAGKPVDR